VYLPLIEAAARRAEADGRMAGGGSETILLVEDDADLREPLAAGADYEWLRRASGLPRA